ncbi:P-loop ATPase, Sll1717 family [Frigidibacter oleivorans]|uniref:P-loop ATPase, Sll1717 family n=1 Tax=Frigidibacter oleivorans TaxID=2487129 RepID=UPI000F8E265F|nr:hypothetical protein [Frigidibacter oleivorans]
MSANTIVLKDGINIGQNGAEHDDDLLFNCFVDHPAYAEVTEVNTSKTFLLGSTGSGKTAILRMIQQRKDHTAPLAIHDMAMNHIASSDTILFLKTLDVDLTLYFQALWRHVFVIEYIKLALNCQTKDQFSFRFSNIVAAIGISQKREKLEKFVERHETNFWNTIDENVVELAQELERSFNAEFGGEVRKFSAKAGYVHTLGSQQKVQLQQRAKQFINRSSLSEIPAVTDALAEYTRGRQDRFYITVDGLDEHWVDDNIKFQLLQAMFEALKALKSLRNFQVVVALRNDLYIKMIRETPASQRQIEKYEDLIIRMKWSKAQLRELADKRIREIFKRKYSSVNVDFDDIFKQYPDSRTSPWDYIFDRTLRRPRDVINFINLALQASVGKSAVSKNNFLQGEASYSNLRYETLVHEWSGTFPAIRPLIELLRDKPVYRKAAEFLHSHFIDEAYYLLGAEQENHNDEIWGQINDSINNVHHLEPLSLARQILYRLHLIGAIGLKLREERPWDWIFDTNRPVAEEQIDSSTKFRVHPMLFVALGIRGK